MVDNQQYAVDDGRGGKNPAHDVFAAVPKMVAVDVASKDSIRSACRLIDHTISNRRRCTKVDIAPHQRWRIGGNWLQDGGPDRNLDKLAVIAMLLATLASACAAPNHPGAAGDAIAQAPSERKLPGAPAVRAATPGDAATPAAK